MPQLVFIHGPGAGACAEAWHYQMKQFPRGLAPTLPGHPQGQRCADVKGYMEWLRGWLWAQGQNRDLVLVGYTMGASIALQYALDHPEEVRGLVLMTVSAGPKQRPAGGDDLRRRAATDPKAFEEWLGHQEHSMHFIEPGLRARLMDSHRKLGPLCQLYDLQAMDAFDVRERVAALKPKLLLIRGADDPVPPVDYEQLIHDVVPGSRYVSLPKSGHVPASERPEEVNRLIEEFVAGL